MSGVKEMAMVIAEPFIEIARRFPAAFQMASSLFSEWLACSVVLLCGPLVVLVRILVGRTFNRPRTKDLHATVQSALHTLVHSLVYVSLG